MYTCLTEDEEEVRRAIDHAKRALLGEMHTLKLLGFRLPTGLETPYQRMLVTDKVDLNLMELQDSVPDEIALECLSAGSSKAVIDTMEKFRMAGATHVIMQLLIPTEEQLRRYAKEVLPYFKRTDGIP